LPRSERVERDLLGHTITEEFGVKGDDLGPKTPKLSIPHAKDRGERVAQTVGAFEEPLLFAGKSECTANESLPAEAPDSGTRHG
jgi:hypothetical protein